MEALMLENLNIFNTVPKKKYLPIYQDNGSMDPQEVTKVLSLRKKDIATATNFPLSSIRFDQSRASKELIDRIKEWGVALEKVAEYFDGDLEKTALWFSLENPLLGNVSPRDMIRLGRFKKLFKFILNSLAENKRGS